MSRRYDMGEGYRPSPTRFPRVLLRGHVKAQLVDDPRGVRFVVRGTPQGSDIEIDVVCRFLPSGLLRIITVYQPES